MTEALLAMSWIAILILALAVFALARQIGVLHERIKPVGALSMGKAIAIGEVTPTIREPSLNGGMVRIGGPSADHRAELLIFVSPSCPVCKTLMPVFTRIGQQESSWLSLVFCSDGQESEHRPIIEGHQLSAYPYVLSTQVGLTYQIGKLPYAVLISADGRLAAHGLVNNREHIESLFEAHAASLENGNAEPVAG